MDLLNGTPSWQRAAVLLSLLSGACGSDAALGGVTLSGDAFAFGSNGGRIAGAEISILEAPEQRVTTAADGHFVFTGLPVGAEATLVLSSPDYHPIQTGTIRLGPGGADRVSFQAVTPAIYAALGAVLRLTPDEDHRCQMVTTVTRVGKSIYDAGAHGEAGVEVTLSPALGPGAEGPIYFNAAVLPDRTLKQTSEDGGVLLAQMPPGEYQLTASKPGVRFTQVKMKCRAGYLVNASPPWGLQALP